MRSIWRSGTRSLPAGRRRARWLFLTVVVLAGASGGTWVTDHCINGPRALDREEHAMMIAHLLPPLVGTAAPPLVLPSLADGPPVALSSFRGDRPVVLAFGSFSCDLFCRNVAALEESYRAYQGRAAFYFVNVREAGHLVPGLEFVVAPGPESGPSRLEARRERTRRAMRIMRLTMPALLDPEDEPAATAYRGWPLRLVAIDTGGTIAVDLGGLERNPWRLTELEQWLDEHGAPAAGTVRAAPG
jgi:hypothetical protein